MEWVILWLIFGVIAGVISNGRGNGFAAGCLFGVLLGPLGIILALVLKPNVQKLETQQIDAGEMKKCPFCAEPIRKEALVCRYCGRDMPALAGTTTRRSVFDQPQGDQPTLFKDT